MLLVFDLDGTLVDSVRDLAEAASELVTQLGGRTLAVAEVSRMVGDGAAALVRRALEAAGVAADSPDALARFLEIYERRLLDHTRPYEGVPEALAYASTRGRLAVLTNKPTRPALAVLEGLGLDGFFHDVIGGDGPFPRKPDPTGLRALQLAAPGQPTLLVGDSPADADTARAAGVGFAFASYGFGAVRFDHPPVTPWVLERPSDLPAVLERFAAVNTGC
ncbi:MAG: HAD family hydrolase [Vicinamibacterales bacterium]